MSTTPVSYLAALGLHLPAALELASDCIAPHFPRWKHGPLYRVR